MLGSLGEQVEAKDWKDEILKTMVLQAVAYHMQGKKKQPYKY